MKKSAKLGEFQVLLPFARSRVRRSKRSKIITLENDIKERAFVEKGRQPFR